MESIERGNEMVGAHINNICYLNGSVHGHSPNPFVYIDLQISDDGCTGTPTIWDGTQQQWVSHCDIGKFSINPRSIESGVRTFSSRAGFLHTTGSMTAALKNLRVGLRNGTFY